MSRCLAAGSRVRLASGEVPIETITNTASIISIRDGVEVVEAIKWIGQRHIDLSRHARPEEAAPIVIRADAIANGRPARDLLISPEHAVFIDGVLVQARALINGGSIAQDRGAQQVTYYHIELDQHGVFYANGLEVESYLDNGDRSFFETDDLPIMLHPALKPHAAFDVRKSGAAYAPFVTDPAAVEPIWRRLAQRSVELGYGATTPQTTQDADLHILADGVALRPIGNADGRVVFLLPAGTRSATVCSRVTIPGDLQSYADDWRRLGVAVRSISIVADGVETTVPADCPLLSDGWHDVERLGSEMWRWTNGAAQLPLNPSSKQMIVTIDCRQVDAYPTYDQRMRPLAA